MRFYSSNEVSLFCEILRRGGFSVSLSKLPLRSELGNYISHYSAYIETVSNDRIEVHFKEMITNREALLITATRATNTQDLLVEIDDIISRLIECISAVPEGTYKHDTVADVLFQLRLFREKMSNG